MGTSGSSKDALRARLLGRNATSPSPKDEKSKAEATRMLMKLPTQKRTKEKGRAIPLPLTQQEEMNMIEALNLEIPQERDAELDTSAGTIRIYCTAEKLDRSRLEECIAMKFGVDMKWYEDGVMYTRYRRSMVEDPKGSVFFFDYGVMITWGLELEEDRDLRKNVLYHAEIERLPVPLIEEDEFSYVCTFKEKPCIVNDTIMLRPRPKEEIETRLAVSHALAQSTKLAVFEDRLSITVDGIIHIPEQLAATGRVSMTGKDIAMLSGDHLQALYKCTYDYLEIESRTEVLNSRFSVMHDLLDMLRDYEHNAHSSRLEWIVIWLIMVEVLVSLFEVSQALGWVRSPEEY